MLLKRQRILNESQLRKLAQHKYSVSSSSLLEPYLQVSISNSLIFAIEHCNVI